MLQVRRVIEVLRDTKEPRALTVRRVLQVHRVSRVLRDTKEPRALTVHKAQGSEYRAVILVLADAGPKLLTRPVLYTAVTRARELLILVGNDRLAYTMIDNAGKNSRYNALRIRIREAYGV